MIGYSLANQLSPRASILSLHCPTCIPLIGETTTNHMLEARMDAIELGFASNSDDNRNQFQSHHWSEWDGGKIGGQPDWLYPSYTPEHSQLHCHKCQTPLSFLMQMYCPLDSEIDAFHRALYVFLCAQSFCSGTFRVFRMQLPRENPFYPFKSGDDANNCKSNCQTANEEQNACVTFPHFDIFSEPEPKLENGTMEEQKLLETYKNRSKVDSEDNPFTNESQIDISQSELDALLGNSQSHDEHYLSFLSKISLAKSQIVRYSRWNSEHVLWVHSQTMQSDIPNCERCGSERKFEFQILPQLLYYLSIDTDSCDTKELEWEWATLVIFTCVKSCALAGDCAEEFIYRQPPQTYTKDSI